MILRIEFFKSCEIFYVCIGIRKFENYKFVVNKREVYFLR